jgi:hypothetical protein
MPPRSSPDETFILTRGKKGRGPSDEREPHPSDLIWLVMPCRCAALSRETRNILLMNQAQLWPTQEWRGHSLKPPNVL